MLILASDFFYGIFFRILTTYMATAFPYLIIEIQFHQVYLASVANLIFQLYSI